MRCSSGTTWRSAVAERAPRLLAQSRSAKPRPDRRRAVVRGWRGRHQSPLRLRRQLRRRARSRHRRGRRVTCSETREPAVYQAVLGGLGRGGIIASAEVELRPFKPRVRTFYLLFQELGAWLEAQRVLIDSNRADYLEAFCTPCVQGLRQGPGGRVPFAEWFYGLHVTLEHEPGPGPAQSEALAGLGLFRLVHVEDNDTVAFAARYDARFAGMRRSGAWLQPHPWVEAMLPGDRLQEILPTVLEAYPLAFGDGPRLLFVDRRRSPLPADAGGPVGRLLCAASGRGSRAYSACCARRPPPHPSHDRRHGRQASALRLDHDDGWGCVARTFRGASCGVDVRTSRARPQRRTRFSAHLHRHRSTAIMRSRRRLFFTPTCERV